MHNSSKKSKTTSSSSISSTPSTSTSNLKSSLKSNSHIDISSAVNLSSSSPKIVLPKNKFGLLKQCSIESAKSTLKKCTHEKTVDFDFLHYKSNENLPTTSTNAAAAAAAALSSTSKCQKHANTVTAPLRSNSPKQCLKHNATVGLSTCLKKSNCDQSVNNKIVEPHLLTCSKSFQAAPTTVSKQCQTMSTCDSTSKTVSSKNCDRCGHVKCAKINDNSNVAKVLIRNEPMSMSSTIVKCNCDHIVATSTKQCVTRQQSSGSSCSGGGGVGALTPPVVIRKKILKSASTTSCPPIEQFTSISSNIDIKTQSDSDMIIIRERIAQAEVFLEAIGHATTVHNYNSSRYVSL